MQFDVAIPTKESDETLARTLECLATAVDDAGATVGRLVVVDDESRDDTRAIASQVASSFDWPCTIVERATTLPEARQLAIVHVDSDWFLFLDDDVRVRPDYLATQLEWVDCPRVGAVQGRKTTRTEPPADWVRRRSRRGGTHATLLRRAAVADVSIPAEVTVLEDEYLRQHVESAGYRWVFEPAARFDHDDQDRHPIGWEEGYVGGKYDLSQFHDVALNVPFSLATGRNPIPHAKRAVGWLAGRARRFERERASPSPIEATERGGAEPSEASETEEAELHG